MTALANLGALVPQYDSKTEEHWAAVADIYLLDAFGVEEVEQLYAPFNYNLNGHWYRADFMHILSDGRVVIVEVKATRKHKGFPTTLIKLKDARARFPFFTWVLAVGGLKGFEVEVL